MVVETFDQQNIREEIKRALKDLNYMNPTPIQKETMPIILENNDVIGQAQTGTGKTAAFGIPIIEKLTTEKFIQALVICPTRELAIQVTNEMRKIMKYLENTSIVPVYGGQSYEVQLRALKKRPQIIVGTPGRIIDLMNRSILKFNNIKTVVLDEADEMLKMGFQEDIETILEKTPDNRQTVMFSATMPKPILDIANKFLSGYKFIKIENKTLTVEKIEQYYYLIKSEQKFDLLIRLIDFYNVQSAIIFCNTKKFVDELVVKLQENNYMTEGLHGDLKQSQRDRVMNSFRSNNVKILVATDVAARGLDVDNVEVIFNLDCPLEEEIYVHRIGRTGRAGKTGIAFTFVTKRQEFRIPQIERYIKQKIKKGKIPTVEEIKYAKSLDLYGVMKENIDKENENMLNPAVEKLVSEGFSKNQIIDSLLKIILQENEKEYSYISELKAKSVAKESGNRKRSKNKVAKVRILKDKKEKKVILYVNTGVKQGVKVYDILDFLKNDFNISKNNIGNIDINKKTSYVELLERDAKKIITSDKAKVIKNKSINVDIIK